MAAGARDPFRVVIVGGGVAALEATLALKALARDPVSIELVAPETSFVYRPLAVMDPFRVGESRTFPLGPLVAAAGGALRRGLVSSVDAQAQFVETRDGERHDYDALLVALGARRRAGVPNALTFAGPESGPALQAVLERAVNGHVRRIAFALPSTMIWPLPLYELALLTNSFLVEHSTTGVEITVVTPEERPLALFGQTASEAIAELLELRGIAFRGGVMPLSFEGGVLRLAQNDAVEADEVVSLARLEGPRLAGLPFDREGFLPVDELCHVGSEPHVYAAGDATRFPLKQGGIATQQADVAATDIATRVGSTTEPTPFRPVLRGLLLTGMSARFLRSEPGTTASIVDTEPLWWPPAKIVGRYVAPFLASKLGLSDPVPPRSASGVEVEVDLDAYDRAGRAV
jgi:sulfide:quinone oxidoreductase